MDIKIKRLKRGFGCSGIAVYDYILCEIYRVKGCFLEWDESTAFDVADYFGLKETLVNEIVNYCCVVGLFNRALFTSGNILTSKSIQSRYIDMCTRAKRKDFKIPEECRIPPEKSPKIPEESPKTPEVCGRVEESKENNNTLTPPRAREPDFETEIFEISDLKKYSGEIWLDEVGMRFHIAPEQLKSSFNEFCDIQELSSYTNTINDFRKHFLNWLNIKIKEKSSGKKEKKNENNSRIFVNPDIDYGEDTI
jgi:hypothetical protein